MCQIRCGFWTALGNIDWVTDVWFIFRLMLYFWHLYNITMLTLFNSTKTCPTDLLICNVLLLGHYWDKAYNCLDTYNYVRFKCSKYWSQHVNWWAKYRFSQSRDNGREEKSSRKSHTQDATTTKPPTVIMQNTCNHTRTQPLTHAYVCTHFLSHNSFTSTSVYRSLTV